MERYNLKALCLCQIKNVMSAKMLKALNQFMKWLYILKQQLNR